MDMSDSLLVVKRACVSGIENDRNSFGENILRGEVQS